MESPLYLIKCRNASAVELADALKYLLSSFDRVPDSNMLISPFVFTINILYQGFLGSKVNGFPIKKHSHNEIKGKE